MYNKLNITETHLRMLSLFTKGFNKEYYIREASRLLDVSPRTAQLILDDLEKKTVLESAARGKIKIYKIKKTEITQFYLTLAEQYKTTSFLEKKPLIREIISKISPFVDGIGAIFGSYAKGIEKKESDIDIFVGGKYSRKEIEKVSGLFGLHVSVKNYPPEIFKKNFKNDILIREITENHILFRGAEDFVKTALENG